jgi:hypothetical protein
MMAFGHAGGIIIALVFAATILVCIDPTKVVRAALQGAAYWAQGAVSDCGGS